MSYESYGHGHESFDFESAESLFPAQPPELYEGWGQLNPVWLKHPGADPYHAVTVLYPYATGRENHMENTMAHIQESLKNTPHNIVGFQSNLYGNPPNQLDSRFYFDIRDGLFQPYAANILTYLENRGISSIDVVGLEQGASVGAVMGTVANTRRLVEVRSATLVEPPNVEQREPSDLLNAVRDFPSVKAMKKALGTRRRMDFAYLHPEYHINPLISKPARGSRLGEIGMSTEDDLNWVMLEGMSRDSFGLDCKLNRDTRIVLVRGQESAVCTNFNSVDSWDVAHIRELEGVGKEIIHNPRIISSMARYAIEGSKFNL